MADFHYALQRHEYTFANAMLWGNCVGHYLNAKYSTTWGPRIVHIIILTLEYLPVISQIASLFEMIIVRCCTKPTDVQNLDVAKETDEPDTPPDEGQPRRKKKQLRVTIKEGEESPPKTPTSNYSPKEGVVSSITSLKSSSEISNPGDPETEKTKQ